MNQTIDTKKLEGHIQKLVYAQGSQSKVSVVPVSDANSVSASINHVNKNIDFQVPFDWNPMQYAKISDFVKKAKVRDATIKVCEDIGFHEVGHNKLKNDRTGLGCPEDLTGKEMAVDAVSKALLEKGKFSQGGALYLENLISDVIDNLNCSQYSSMNGLSMFFAEQGEINKGKYSPLYEAFVKLNMNLHGKKKQKKLMENYYTNDEKIDSAITNCITEIGLSNKKQDNLQLLFDKTKWEDTFYKFALYLAEFMEESCPEMLPGSGSNGKGYKVPANFDETAEFNPDEINDPMMKKLLDKDNMKKVMMRRNQNGESLPCFIEDWRALDYFYQGLASELRIKAETPKKGQSMKIAPIQARQYDQDKDNLEQILFGRILIDEQGLPCFAVPRDYIEKTIKYKKSIHSYPDLSIAVLDSSSSMLEGANGNGAGNKNIVPWGDNSKYHYALLTEYGVEKALHAMGIGVKTRYNMITFGSRTEATGEKTYNEKDSIKKRMLQPNFQSSTNIDLNVLKKHTTESGSVLMTISDGEIVNWDDIKNDFKRIIQDKFYVHFQIGAFSKDANGEVTGKPEICKDLESFGARVVYLDDASSMPKQAINITQKFYKSYASGDLK